MNDDLIATLISQHNDLRRGILTIIEAEEFNASGIFENLENFKKTLSNHLNLEDNMFYPGVLKKLENRKIETETVLKFIEEMKIIAEKVFMFFEKYDKEEKIKMNQEEFKTDFKRISETLNIRMESEEDGIYMYWNI